VTLGKISAGGGPVALLFWSLKKGSITFNISLNEPSSDTLGPLDRYNHPWGKNKINDKKTTKKHASVIFFRAKHRKFLIFADRSLKPEHLGSLIP